MIVDSDISVKSPSPSTWCSGSNVLLQQSCSSAKISDNGNLAKTTAQRVVVEPIIEAVDVGALSAAVEKTFASNENGNCVVLPVALSNSENDALATTARRLLMEIIEDEKRQVENGKTGVWGCQRRSKVSRTSLPKSLDTCTADRNSSRKQISRPSETNAISRGIQISQVTTSTKRHSGRPRKDVLEPSPTISVRKKDRKKIENVKGSSLERNRKATVDEKKPVVIEDENLSKAVAAVNGTTAPQRTESLILKIKKPRPSNLDQEKPFASRRTVVCADSDHDESRKQVVSSIAPNAVVDQKASTSTDPDEDVQYPCTVCRKSSVADQSIRCTNGPRYSHQDCFETTEQDKRNLCAKCAHAAYLENAMSASSELVTKQKKRKFEADLPSDGSAVVAKRIRILTSDSSIRKEELKEKLCPGCRKRFKPTLKDKESIYCSNECIEAVIERVHETFTDLQERVLVGNGDTGQILKKPNSPAVQNFATWLRKHRGYYPILPAVESRVPDEASVPESSTISGSQCNHESNTPSTYQVAEFSEKRTNSPNVIPPKIPFPQEKNNSVVDQDRLNVRKAFRDVLVLRAKGADDILLTNEEIKFLALDLEKNVYNCHWGDKNGDSAYKEQCRNLLSTLRNPTNKGFFRRILNGELSCKRAAMLTAQQIASKEYSFWSTEESVCELAGRGAKISHTAADSSSRVRDKDGAACGVLDLLQNDTTPDHKSHLFDVNCKICTGKLSRGVHGYPKPGPNPRGPSRVH